MAKLEALPSSAIIDQLAGTIDYYLWMGIPCARSWPRARQVPITPQERAAWPVFTDAVRIWNTLSTEVQAAYNAMAAGSTLSGRDMATKLYINAKKILPY
jgi:hypothetical protein